jgi:hypothetical protein
MAGPLNTNVIQNANPYTVFPATQADFVNPPLVEQQLDVGTWTFKGVPHYIEKALKIPYTYTDANGVYIQEYLLIGFAGGGAY